MKLSFATPQIDGMDPAVMEQDLKALSAMGYEAVEYLINDPAKVDKPLLKRLLAQYGMQVSGFRSGAIYGADPALRLSNPAEADRRRAVEQLKAVCELCGEFSTNVCIGLMQGHLGAGETYPQARQWIVECLRECSEHAGRFGVSIFYEPVNRYELEYHNRVQEMVEVVDEINAGLNNKVLLLLDVFHMHLEDPSIPSALVRGIHHMGHVHFADSNRLAPGCGCIDFVEVFKLLYAMDYKGYITTECLPVPSLLESARLTMDYIKPIMQATGKSYKF